MELIDIQIGNKYYIKIIRFKKNTCSCRLLEKV